MSLSEYLFVNILLTWIKNTMHGCMDDTVITSHPWFCTKSTETAALLNNLRVPHSNICLGIELGVQWHRACWSMDVEFIHTSGQTKDRSWQTSGLPGGWLWRRPFPSRLRAYSVPAQAILTTVVDLSGHSIFFLSSKLSYLERQVSELQCDASMKKINTGKSQYSVGYTVALKQYQYCVYRSVAS